MFVTAAERNTWLIKNYTAVNCLIKLRKNTTVRTIPKATRNNAERGTIATSNIKVHVHDRYFSSLGTGTSKKWRGWINFMDPKSPLLVKCFYLISKFSDENLLLIGASNNKYVFVAYPVVRNIWNMFVLSFLIAKS